MRNTWLVIANTEVRGTLLTSTDIIIIIALQTAELEVPLKRNFNSFCPHFLFCFALDLWWSAKNILVFTCFPFPACKWLSASSEFSWFRPLSLPSTSVMGKWAGDSSWASSCQVVLFTNQDMLILALFSKCAVTLKKLWANGSIGIDTHMPVWAIISCTTSSYKMWTDWHFVWVDDMWEWTVTHWAATS